MDKEFNTDLVNYKQDYIPLFYDRTFDQILDEDLAMIDEAFDKREGSVIYDALAPMSMEVSLLYSYLDFLFRNAYAVTSNRYWLIQRAKERGIYPKPATRARAIGKFNVDVPISHRFQTRDGVFFLVQEYIEEKEGFHLYDLICEDVGVIGNVAPGPIIPQSTVPGLETAEIVKISILGEDEEETERFRNRYFETIRSNAYGGNIDDYRQKVSLIDGVGLVKVIPVWNGGGTVKVIITDAEYKKPTEELIAKVQEILDPVPHHQKGVGVAPIGHYVTVEGAEAKKINISLDLTLERGASPQEVESRIKKDLDQYFREIRMQWSEFDLDEVEIYRDSNIRLAKIISTVLNVEGVIDFKNISFTDVEGGVFTLKASELPYLGTVTMTSGV